MQSFSSTPLVAQAIQAGDPMEALSLAIAPMNTGDEGNIQSKIMLEHFKKVCNTTHILSLPKKHFKLLRPLTSVMGIGRFGGDDEQNVQDMPMPIDDMLFDSYNDDQASAGSEMLPGTQAINLISGQIARVGEDGPRDQDDDDDDDYQFFRVSYD